MSRLLCIVPLLLLGCEDTRRLDAGARDARREAPPFDAVRERAPTDSVHEPRPVDAGLFSCAALLGGVSVQGQVAGKPLGATAALAASVSATAQPPATLLFAKSGAACAGVTPANLVLRIGLCQGAPGSTAIGQLCGNGARAFARLAASLGAAEAATGTVTLESWGAECGGRSKGSFVLAFPDQGGPALLSGSFEAAGCGALP